MFQKDAALAVTSSSYDASVPINLYFSDSKADKILIFSGSILRESSNNAVDTSIFSRYFLIISIFKFYIQYG